MKKRVHHLNIGPVRFVLHGEQDEPLRYDAWGYRDFFAECGADDGVKPLVEMDVKIRHGKVALPPNRPLYESGKNWAVWPDGDHWLFFSRYAGREYPGFCCRVSRDLTQAVLHVADDSAVDPLRYPLDQILTWGLLTRCGGVLMHSALVTRKGTGLVLAGCSGAGKSTLAALCREQGWHGLNDDRAILYQQDGLPRAAGTPWHGTGLLAEAGDVPPAAILLLEQSDSIRLEKVPPRSAKLELLDVTSIPWFEDDWSQGALDALDALVESIPVYRFYFSKTQSAVCALEQFAQDVCVNQPREVLI